MRFAKMQGVGNDFVVVDQAIAPPDMDWPAFAVRACDRHFGIGADGLLVIAVSAPRLAMRMFNPDGTEDMCGNGLRCAALWAYRGGWATAGKPFAVSTKEGEKTIVLNSVGPDCRSAVATVDMGGPRFDPAAVPFSIAGRDSLIDYPLAVDGAVLPVTSINTGSTHTVIFGDRPDEEAFRRLSAAIEVHPAFPERTSVMWAAPAGESAFDLRIWERGVGETLGCGTGACAVAVAARIGGLAGPAAPIAVRSRGGELQIDWPGPGRSIAMTGPAVFVYDGRLGV
jgi:diaminopimelate epimerase